MFLNIFCLLLSKIFLFFLFLVEFTKKGDIMFRIEIFINEMLEKINNAELLLTKKGIAKEYPELEKSI